MELNSLVKLGLFLSFNFLATTQRRFQERRRPWLGCSAASFYSVYARETERQVVIASLFSPDGNQLISMLVRGCPDEKML